MAKHLYIQHRIHAVEMLNEFIFKIRTIGLALFQDDIKKLICLGWTSYLIINEFNIRNTFLTTLKNFD